MEIKTKKYFKLLHNHKINLLNQLQNKRFNMSFSNFWRERQRKIHQTNYLMKIGTSILWACWAMSIYALLTKLRKIQLLYQTINSIHKERKKPTTWMPIAYQEVWDWKYWNKSSHSEKEEGRSSSETWNWSCRLFDFSEMHQFHWRNVPPQWTKFWKQFYIFLKIEWNCERPC